MMASNIDYSLYLVTDRALSGKRCLDAIVAEAVAGGVTCVQLREKNLQTRQFVEEARALVSLLQPRNIPLIINDRLDVALAAGAAGVHLGQKDMAIRDARQLLPAGSVIGISAECLRDALEAEREGADYVGISPVFATSTKDDHAPPLGLEGVAQLRRHVRIPLVGIGGIGRDNAAQVIASGADGVAVVSAIMAAPSAERAAAELLERVRHGRAEL